MSKPENSPNTLMEAVKHFADPDVAHAYVASIKWPNGKPACPKCGSCAVGFVASRRTYQCRDRNCRKQFSVKVGTIFEDSPLGLDKWLVSIWSIVNAKNGISSCELARAIGVTQKSAWHMLHRIRLAMRTESFNRIVGEIESDESFVGGKFKNMHKSKRSGKPTGRGAVGKTIVQGILERGGDVRAKVVKNQKRSTLQSIIRENVEPGSVVYTDTLKSYEGLSDEYVHAMIDHAVRYVDGRIHTNSMENFWSLLKRMLLGTYVKAAPEHLDRYLDEQTPRFNLRKLNDGQRFYETIKGIVGRRLTYRGLISKGV